MSLEIHSKEVIYRICNFPNSSANRDEMVAKLGRLSQKTCDFYIENGENKNLHKKQQPAAQNHCRL